MPPHKELNDRFNGYQAKARWLGALGESILLAGLVAGGALAFEIAVPPGSVHRAQLARVIPTTQSAAAANGKIVDTIGNILQAVGIAIARLQLPSTGATTSTFSRMATSSRQVAAAGIVQSNKTTGSAATATTTPKITKPATPSLPAPKQSTAQKVRNILSSQSDSVHPIDLLNLRSSLEAQLNAVATNLHLELSYISSAPPYPQQVAAGGTTVLYNSPASERIDKLQNVSIRNASVSGISGLTDADVPDSITASNYLALTGGTLTGNLSLSGTLTAGTLSVAGISSGGAIAAPYFSATSTSASSTFTNFNVTNSTTTNATSTNLFSTLGRFTTAVSDTLTSVAATITNLTSTTLVATNATTTRVDALDYVAVGRTATTTIRGDGVASTLPFASTTAITSAYASSTSGFFGTLSIGSLSGFLKATAGSIAAALVDLASNVTGILPPANGGTGWSNVASGAVVLGNGTGALATTSAGTNGQVLALVSGTPTWVATTSLSTISGTLGVSQGGTSQDSSGWTGVAVISSGTWSASSTLALNVGGTGAATASGARTNLGLGTAAVQNTGTSGAYVPLLNGANTWSAAQTINAGGNENLFLSDGTNRSSIQQSGAGLYINLNDNLGGHGVAIWRSSNAFTELMRLNSTGLGIGNTSPSQTLSVVKSTDGTIAGFGANGAENLLTIGYDVAGIGGEIELKSSLFGPLVLRTQNNKHVLLLPNGSGNVGIGLSSPAYKLDVTGLGHFTGLVDAANFTATSSSATSTLAGGLAVKTTSLVVDSTTGNVGIGTASPGYALDVNGITSIRAGNALRLWESGNSNYSKISSPSSGAFQIDTGGVTGALHIANLGNVGIGTTTPSAKLTVHDASTYTPTSLILSGAEPWRYYGLIRPYTDAGATYLGLGVRSNNVDYFDTLAIKEGKVGVAMTNPSVALDVTGDIEYTGTITDVSDERLKENIQPLDGALALLAQIDGKSFSMIGSTSTEFGFIAQNVQAVLPEAVSVVDPEHGYLGVSYLDFIPWLVEGIKEIASITGTFKANLIAWLADSANGIEKIFTKEFVATNITADRGSFTTLTASSTISDTATFGKLCVGTICITQDQFMSVFGGGSQVASPTAASTPIEAMPQEAPAASPASEGEDTSSVSTTTASEAEPTPAAAAPSQSDPTVAPTQPEAAANDTAPAEQDPADTVHAEPELEAAIDNASPSESADQPPQPAPTNRSAEK